VATPAKVAVLAPNSVSSVLLDQYISDVEATFNSDTNPLNDVDLTKYIGSWTDASEVRGFLIQRYESDRIQGAVLVGLLPYPLWDNPPYYSGAYVCPMTLYYMDLDGEFHDRDHDGSIDYWHWAEQTGGNEGMEIWVSLMRPPENLPSGFLDIDGFLSKCHQYYNRERYIPHRALIVVMLLQKATGTNPSVRYILRKRSP